MSKDDNDYYLKKKFLVSKNLKLNLTQTRVMVCMKENRKGYIPSLTQISHETGISIQNISRAIKGLKTRDLIEIAGFISFGNGRRTPSFIFTENFEAKFKEWKRQLQLVPRDKNLWSLQTNKKEGRSKYNNDLSSLEAMKTRTINKIKQRREINNEK